jgi:hypothetical protein
VTTHRAREPLLLAGPRAILLALLAGVTACGGGARSPDRDAGRGDEDDAGRPPVDAGPPDAGPQDAGRDAGSEPDAGGDDDDFPEGTRFVDVTSDWGITHERSFVTPDARDTMASGACVIDVDGTPPLDLFFTRLEADGGSLLYVGEGYGAYREDTAARGLDGVEDALGCLAFDAEGDGDQDLLAFGYRRIQLFENGGGVFEEAPDRVEALSTEFGLYTAAAAGDVDRDGDLDVAVVGYVDWDPLFHAPGVICRSTAVPCTFEPGFHPFIPNVLLIQQDDGTFTDIEIELQEQRLREELFNTTCQSSIFPLGRPGCPARLEGFYEPRPSLAVGIADFNQDRRVDLFIGNDFGTPDQVLTRFDDGFWIDAGPEFGLARNWQGRGMDTMGWASGDIDGDTILDHVRTDFEDFESAVHVSRGRLDLFEDEAPTIGGILDRKDTFRWGAAFVDIDLDGDLDLLEATGHVYRPEHFEAVGVVGPVAQPTNLFENSGTGSFVAVDPVEGGGLSIPTESRSLNVADLDDDGRPDLLLGNVLGPPSILRNVTPRAGHWLRLRLVGPGRDREAALTRVEVTAGEGVFTRVKKLGEGYGGSGDPRLLFGLPTDQPVSIEVFWWDGTTSVVDDVAVDQELTITHP